MLAPDAPGIAYTPAFSPDGRHDRLLALEAGRLPRHPRLRSDARYRSRADDRPRDGRRPALHARRPVPAVVVRPHRHLRRLRVRARDGAAVSGDQRAVGRVPARRLHRRRASSSTPASPVDGFDLYAMPFDPKAFRLAQPFANARPTRPPTLDADSDSPDAVVGAAAVADDHAHDQLQAVEVHVPADLEHQLLLRGARHGHARGSSARRSAIRSATTTWRRTCWSRSSGDPSVAVGYSYTRLFPSFDLSFRRTAQQRAGPDHRRRQHALPATRDRRHGVDAPDLPADAVRRPASCPSATTTTRTGPPIPLPLADPDGRHHRAAGDRARRERLHVVVLLATSTPGATRSAARKGASSAVNLRFSDPTLGGRFHTTEMSGVWQEYLTPPWARLHALALLWSGGIGIGDKRDFFGLGGFFEQDILRTLFLGRPQCCTLPARLPAATASSATLPDRLGRIPGAAAPDRTRLPDVPGVLPAAVGRGVRRRGQRLPGTFQPTQLKTDVGVETTLLEPALLPRDAAQVRLRARLLRAGRQPVVLPRRRVLLTLTRETLLLSEP